MTLKYIAEVLALGVIASFAGVCSSVAESPLGRLDPGTFSGSGTIVEGPNATQRKVNCTLNVAETSTDRVVIGGSCRALAIFTRAIGATLQTLEGGRLVGTFTGNRVGTARLAGTRRGNVINLGIAWPAPVYGDTTARMTVTTLDKDHLRLVVTDRIFANGPTVATTDLVLARR